MMNAELTPMEYKRLQHLIEEKCGISLGEDKAYLLESRLVGLLAELGLAGFEALSQMIVCNQDRSLIEKVIDAVVTNETFWFRDKSPWNILENILLPGYIRELSEGTRSKVRIWSAACSSGQEPYSIAMCIDRYLARNGIEGLSLTNFEILATDISGSILQMAMEGRYDSISLTRGMDDAYKELYFQNTGRVWTLSERIRRAVSFRRFNLQDDFTGLGSFDVVFLRNVLIYFSEGLKRQVIDKTASVLGKSGVLFIGSSELLAGGRFKSRTYKESLYYQLE